MITTNKNQNSYNRWSSYREKQNNQYR